MTEGDRGAALRIRRGRGGDWRAARLLFEEVDRLHAELAPEYFRSGGREEKEWRRSIDDPMAAVYVAELGPDGAGKLVGVVTVRIYDTPENPAMVPRRRGHVETLVVAGAARRRGIGRRLMSEVVAWARDRGAVEVVLTTWAGNAAADAFYERLGYRILSRVLHTRID